MIVIASGLFYIGYPYLFRISVDGKVVSAKALPSFNSQTGSEVSIGIILKVNDQMYSASSEDRQWLAVEKEMCVRASLYPYAPWELMKSGSFHSARLVAVIDCK